MRLPPLYAILDVDLAAARGLAPDVVLDAWLDAGVRLVQLRAKRMPGGPLLDLAERLAAASRAAGATFIVNDRADVARLSGASGVHVGQMDLAPDDVRRIVGSDAVVGMSTHTDGQMEEALSLPVDYVAIGPVYETSTKEQPDPMVGLEGVRHAAALARRSGIPLVAIGGITLERAPAVLEAGASSVAVVSDLLSGEPRARARQLLSAIT